MNIVDEDVRKYIVCRSGHTYDWRVIYKWETFEEVVDEMDGSKVTIIKKNGEVVDTSGELCCVVRTANEASTMVARLREISKVMEY